MKYLAILKDSVREAIDNKVIYVMIALSVLVTLIVLTLSFKPLTAPQMMERAANGKALGLEEMVGADEHGVARRGNKGWKNVAPFVVRAVEVLRESPDPADSSYRVKLGVAQPAKDAAVFLPETPRQRLARLQLHLMQAAQIGCFKVTEVRQLKADQPAGEKDKDADASAVAFEFTTEPMEGSRLAWGHEFSLFLGAVPLGSGAPLGPVLFITVIGVLWIGSLVTLLVSVIITAFFIPNMLRKGTVDLLLVKPIRRWALLLYKYIGGLTFILVNTTVAILGIWLAMGLRSGVWANSFLLMIFVYTFFFAILYAISTLFAVLTRSSIVAILATIGIWFVLFIVGQLYAFGEVMAMREQRDRVPTAERSSDNGFWTVVRAVHFVLPRTSDINQLGNEALARDFLPPRLLQLGRLVERQSFHWGESITVSLAFIAVMLGLSCRRFATRDY
jgi:ABC-type transport system involved in multi-copper enzyme maturation permease subunit